MKKSLLKIVFILLFSLISKTALFSQTATIVSTDGYTVNIIVQPKTIVPTSATCADGYNYNVRMDYQITFSGTNIPSSLYTLQGTLGCGTSTHFFDLPNNGGTGNVLSQSNVWRPQHDCSTATVASLSCTKVTIEIEGPGISSRNVVLSNPAALPLPIKLVNFTAEPIGTKVKLQWATATETNNDHFTIEKSIDGSVWSAIKTIKGAGNSFDLITYNSFDEHPTSGTSYYRLKQTDIDGKSTYSDVRSVKYTTGDKKSDFSVFPVPNAGNTIYFRGITEPANTVITIRNATGVSVYTTTLSSSSVQLPNLTAGIYVISLNDKTTGTTTNLRYVKI